MLIRIIFFGSQEQNTSNYPELDILTKSLFMTELKNYKFHTLFITQL